jgi:hypothetical protein
VRLRWFSFLFSFLGFPPVNGNSTTGEVVLLDLIVISWVCHVADPGNSPSRGRAPRTIDSSRIIVASFERLRWCFIVGSFAQFRCRSLTALHNRFIPHNRGFVRAPSMSPWVRSRGFGVEPSVGCPTNPRRSRHVDAQTDSSTLQYASGFQFRSPDQEFPEVV